MPSQWHRPFAASAAFAAFYMASGCGRNSCMSLIEVVLTVFVRESDSNAAARQCLAKKYLDFGIDAP